MREIAFTKTGLPWGWLGNMSAHPVEYKGKLYPTTEHLFQAMRLPEGHPAVEEICKHNSPMRAKMVIKGFQEDFITTPRSKADIENMMVALLLKVDTYPDLKSELVDSKGLDIIEDCSNRPTESGLFWGAKKTPNGWVGNNQLGKCWMDLRNLL